MRKPSTPATASCVQEFFEAKRRGAEIAERGAEFFEWLFALCDSLCGLRVSIISLAETFGIPVWRLTLRNSSLGCLG